jgi:hypothetical protein
MMAGEIYLGPSGSETTLPALIWTGGSAPSIPNSVAKNIESQTMADGSRRFNIKTYHPARWQLEWERLSAAEIVTLTALAAYNEKLHYKNTMFDSSYRWAVITTFSYFPILFTIAQGVPYYAATMTLEEVK